MKFGAKPPKRDGRIKNVSSVFRVAMVPPPAYDFDASHPGIPIPLFANADYNDCVIAARAHHTLRLAVHAGRPLPNISDQDVINEYRTENAAEDGVFDDKGVTFVTSLSEWTRAGWTAAGTPHRTIADFFSVNWQINDELKNALIAATGVQVSLNLPDGLQNDGNFGPGNPWTDADAVGAFFHVILLTGYDTNGPIGITWGEKQNISWEFFHAFCVEAYTVVGNANT